MTLLYIIPAAISFIVTLLLVPSWIVYCRRHGLLSDDRHKPGKRIPSWGGLLVLAGFLAGMLVYTLFPGQVLDGHLSFFLATSSSLLMAALIGFVDDIMPWKSGLSRYYKVFLSVIIPVPIILFALDHSQLHLPFFGAIEMGLVYPLLIMPVVTVIASNSFNMLAGYNGLEAGAGILIISTLTYLSWTSGHAGAAMVGLCAVAASFAFIIFNWSPARIFPGNSFTYFTGSCAAIVAILGKLEIFAAILFIPYLVEFVLKIRGRFRKESFGRPAGRGSIGLPYKKLYGLEHVAIDVLIRAFGRAYEWQVTLLLLITQALFVVLVLFLAII